MLTYPPLPPKDYVIKEIMKNQLTSSVFTPTQEPRITLKSWGLHAVPVEARACDPAPREKFSAVNPNVVDRWVKNARHHWVCKPGENAYLLHDTYKKYNVRVCDSYDSRYIHRAPVFPRSFKYEIDCLKEYQLQKLEDKTIREEAEHRRRLYQVKPPASTKKNLEMPEPPQSTYKASYKRWQEKPALFAPSQVDPCMKRAEFALVGQPFRNEACNWYYENYPPPKLDTRVEKIK